MGQIGRRRFLAAASALLALPRKGLAQPSKGVYRVGALLLDSAQSKGAKRYFIALREALAAHGFIDGQNLQLDTRAAAVRSDARFHAQDLLKLNPDALFTLGTEITLGAQEVTTSVPIVFAWVADPKISGIVKDYAKPGGNATGVTNRSAELMTKRLEIVKELLPQAKRVVVISAVWAPVVETIFRLAGPTAEKLGLRLERSEPGLSYWAQAIREAANHKVDAAIIMIPFLPYGMRNQAVETIEEARRERMPVIYYDSETVELGGLISYATNLTEDVRRGASYLARVLKGTRPGDLPVDQAARFEMVLNLKTAKAIGLTIPQSILLRADRVIE